MLHIFAKLISALARIGKRVLHLDYNDFYGEYFGTFTLQQFEAFLQNTERCPVPRIASSPTDEPLPDQHPLLPRYISNAVIYRYFDADTENLYQHNRFYNIDVTPRVVYSEGALVDTIIESGVGRYLEFRAIDRCCIYAARKDTSETHWRLSPVPGSRNDIFTSPLLKPIQRRLLMKFMERVAADNDPALSTISFSEYLRASVLKDDLELQSFVCYGVGLLDYVASASGPTALAPECTAANALRRIRQYISSVGRYAESTPFLATLYGTSEVAQAFCRLAAVFGAAYVLRRTAAKIVLSTPLAGAIDNAQPPQCTGIVCNAGQPLTCRWLAASRDAVPTSWIAPNAPRTVLSRCVLITDSSLVIDNASIAGTAPLPDNASVAAAISPNAPGVGNRYAVRMVQYGHPMRVVPRGKFVVYLVTIATEGATAEDDLKSTVAHFFDLGPGPQTRPSDNAVATDTTEANSANGPTRPRVLWCAYYNVTAISATAAADGTTRPANVLIAADPAADDSGLDSEVAEARRMFDAITAGENGVEFLPRAPDPEDMALIAELEQKRQHEESVQTRTEEQKTEEQAEAEQGSSV